MQFDTILLVGDGIGSKQVFGQNKSFLLIRKVPSFIHVLATLQKVALVKGIRIVGPKQKVQTLLKEYLSYWKGSKEVTVIDQGSTLLDNIEKAVQATLDPECELPVEKVFLLPGDIPLVEEPEISEFLSKVAAMTAADYVIGMVSKTSFSRSRFLCDKDKVSKMLWFPFRENWYRINNLHVINPEAPFCKSLILQMYMLRHNKNLSSICHVFLGLGKFGNLIGVFYYALVQWAILLQLLGLHLLSEPIRFCIPVKRIENIVSILLGVRVTAVETSFGMAAMDIDSESDYFQILKKTENLSENKI